MRSLLPLLATLLLSAPALADPLALSSIPSDARWLIHIDVDAGSKTPLWELARTRIPQAQRETLLPRMEILQRLTGLNFPQDLHDVSLYGTTYDEADTCILFHATIDPDRTLTLLKTDREFSSEDHNGHAIFSWRDKQRDHLMYGSFAGKDIAILARDPHVVARALDTLDAKSPGLKPDSPLAPASGTSGHPCFWIAGTNISELARLQKAESPLVTQVDAASFGGSWSDDKFLAHIQLVAKTDKAATQMLALAEGVKAMVALAASDEHAAPATKIASSTLQSLSLTADGKQLTGDWSVSVDRIEGLINIAKQDALPAVSPNTAMKAATPADNK